MLTTTVKTLKALALFAGKNDVRKYLNGICIQAKTGASHAILAATDGRRLLAVRAGVHEPPSQDLGVVLQVDAVKALKYDDHVGIAVGDTSITLTTCLGTTTVPAIELGPYPDWRRVVPKTFSGEPAFYKPDYLADAMKAKKLLAGDKRPYLSICMNGDGPAYLDMGVDHAIAIAMPVRGSLLSKADAPEWVFE